METRDGWNSFPAGKVVELARKASSESLTITADPRLAATRGLYVSSASEPATRYLVTRHSCTCKGHLFHGYCKHRALALVTMDVIRAAHREPVAA